MENKNIQFKGLSTSEVEASRLKYGENKLEFKKEYGILKNIIDIFKEPMVILLLIASSIYFISGEIGDGLFLSGAIVLISFISLFQNSRSKNALAKLKDLSQPHSKVIRNEKIIEIKSEEIVVGDCMMVEEGSFISADGKIVQSNDFSVNESILTGESMAVSKDKSSNNHLVFSGTTVVSGLAYVEVSHIGHSTQLGTIGDSLESIQEEKTPLEKQIEGFVKKMVIFGAIIFFIVWILNYLESYLLGDSLLKALTLAMSILPEEIPVAFTTFMALGAWRLMKFGTVVKQMKTVETLGSATVICTDKTGTLTENKMSLTKIYSLENQKIKTISDPLSDSEKEVIEIAMWASEPIPFDPMEISLHEFYIKNTSKDLRGDYEMYHEYPLEGKPPMMTHLFKNKEGKRIIATKGAPEAIMNASLLSEEEKSKIQDAIRSLAKEGLRLLGVANTEMQSDDFPKTQQEFPFVFKGIVAFYDPPKQNIKEVLNKFYNAGIKVKIITGDNHETTMAIAQKIDFRGYEKSISGDELMKLNDVELKKCVHETTLFTRMFPEAKLKIINALKSQNEIVAMTGDGVNDGPALKSAHIGVAMGKKGTEIAKQAASIILLEDDLSNMVEAVAMGRKIYYNLKKAIQYIISIHIPIVLMVFIPLALGWIYPNIFSPLHVIFLEVIMGPTCSIIYENEPMEKNTMLQPPREVSNTFFNMKELSLSIFQGLIITIGILLIYQYAVAQHYSEEITRTMCFTSLITANVFLTLVNRSFSYSIFTTIKYKNRLVPLIISITTILVILLFYFPPLTQFFEFEKPTLSQVIIPMVVGFISVIWFEVVKLWKR